MDCGSSHAYPKFMYLQKDIQKVNVSSVCTLSSFLSPLNWMLIVAGLIPTGFNSIRRKQQWKKLSFWEVWLLSNVSQKSQLTSRCLVFEQHAFNKQPVGQWPCRWIANSKLLASGKKQWPGSRQLHWVVIRSIRYSEALWHCRVFTLKDTHCLIFLSLVSYIPVKQQIFIWKLLVFRP